MLLFKCVNREGGSTERGIPAANIVCISAASADRSKCRVQYKDYTNGGYRVVCVEGSVSHTIERINNFSNDKEV